MARAFCNVLAGVAAALGVVFTPHVAAEETHFPLPPSNWPPPVEDNSRFAFFLADRLEYTAQPGKDAWAWDAEGWYGADYTKLWLKAEGEREIGGSTRDSTVDVLYARRIAPYWYLQAGARVEDRPGPRRTFGEIGVEGIAPDWFEVGAALYARGNGALGARLEAENNFYFTQRLILQPRMEARLSARSDPERGLGSGLNSLELGLRLRYEIRREFAPYIGVTWTGRFGETADFAQARGEDARSTALVAGVRMWF